MRSVRRALEANVVDDEAKSARSLLDLLGTFLLQARTLPAMVQTLPSEGGKE
jgi:hypothetical protein